MTGRTHDAVAFASLVTVATIFPPEDLNLYTAFAAVIASNVGALMPDMDSAGNRLWSFFPAGHHLSKYYRRIFYKHRTLSHSLLGTFIVYKLLQIILPVFFNPEFIKPEIVLAATMIGYISHIAADAFTEEGVPLLFPWRVSFGFPPISSWRIKTGQWFEKFVIYPGLWIYLLWFVERNKNVVVEMLQSIST